MDLERAHELLRQHHRAVMVTWRRDGRPQMSPVICGLHEDGCVRVSTRETAMKTKNLRRDPRASLCVFSDEFFDGAFVQIDGSAEIVSLPDAMEQLVDYYRDLRGEHPNWDEYRDEMQTQQRVMVRITIDHAGPDQAG